MGNACGSWCGWCGRCDDDPRLVAECRDCGDAYVPVYRDVSARCESCQLKREAWLLAFRVRMATVAADLLTAVLAQSAADDARDAAIMKRMAKAVLDADLTKLKEIA